MEWEIRYTLDVATGQLIASETTPIYDSQSRFVSLFNMKTIEMMMQVGTYYVMEFVLEVLWRIHVMWQIRLKTWRKVVTQSAPVFYSPHWECFLSSECSQCLSARGENAPPLFRCSLSSQHRFSPAGACLHRHIRKNLQDDIFVLVEKENAKWQQFIWYAAWRWEVTMARNIFHYSLYDGMVGGTWSLKKYEISLAQSSHFCLNNVALVILRYFIKAE